VINKQVATETQRFHKGPQSREIAPGALAMWLERAILGALFLFVIAAPTSIAATQTAWLLGMLFWVLRLMVWPRPKVHRTTIDYALLGFVILTGVSSLLSYEPMVSIGKLRAASLFTIVYLFAQNIRSARVLRTLALLLIVACVVSALYTFGLYAFGRGVKVYGLRPDSPLSAAKLVAPPDIRALPIFTGDTLEEIDGNKVRGPEDLTAGLESGAGKGPAKIKIYRVEWNPVLEVPRGLSIFAEEVVNGSEIGICGIGWFDRNRFLEHSSRFVISTLRVINSAEIAITQPIIRREFDHLQKFRLGIRVPA